MAYRIEIKEKFSNKYWRLNNLYWIIDKKGRKVRFRLNSEQERLYDDLWYLNIILKARQFGGTTFTDIYFLDECIFNDNVEAGIIAHNKEDAQKIFRRKVKYPYEHLPEGIKSRVYPTTDSRSELAFNNGSIIYVGTSMRSGTLQYLHISEHGKICKKYPEKAEEIRTGSLNAIEAGQLVVIESTAEGAYGDFHDFCRKAMEKKSSGEPLTPMDYKFHFFPWYETDDYRIDPDGITIDEDHTKYFNTLERSLGITIDDAQRAWYVKKEETQGDKMKQEYPSTPEEAFEAGGKGLNFYRDHHVIEPIPIPEGAPLYMTFDYGFAKPYSAGYWWVDQDNRIYRFSELYGNDKGADSPDTGLRQTDPEIAKAILAHEEGLKINNRSITRLCDPTCFNKKPDYLGGGQGKSTAEVFTSFGINMIPGDARRDLKIRQFRNRLTLLEDERPMMLVYSTCTDFIRTIPLLRDDDKNPEDIDTTMEDHCFDDQTEVLTDAGWKLFGDLNKTERLATMNSGGLIEYHEPYRYIEREFNGELISYEGRISLRATDGHRLPVVSKYYHRMKQDTWSHKKLTDIRDDCYLPRIGRWNGFTGIGDYRNPQDIYLPNEQNGNSNNAPRIDLKSFLLFYGFWLAEGCMCHNSDTHYSVHVDQVNDVEDIVRNLGYRYHKTVNGAGCTRYTIQSKQLFKYLESLHGISRCNTKHIPRWILELPSEYIRYVYDGMMLGDGSMNKGMPTYSTTSKRLADDFQELLFKIGKVGNIKKYYQKHTHILGRKIKSKLPYYRIHVLSHDHAMLVKNKWGKEKYNGRVYCVSIENETLFVRRNGTPYWSSNCYDEACHICMARPISLEELKPRKSQWERRIDELMRDKEEGDGFETEARLASRQALSDLGVDLWDEEDRFLDRGEVVETMV